MTPLEITLLVVVGILAVALWIIAITCVVALGRSQCDPMSAADLVRAINERPADEWVERKREGAKDERP